MKVNHIALQEDMRAVHSMQKRYTTGENTKDFSFQLQLALQVAQAIKEEKKGKR